MVFLTKTNGYQKMCETRMWMGMIIKGFIVDITINWIMLWDANWEGKEILLKHHKEQVFSFWKKLRNLSKFFGRFDVM